MSEQQCLLVKTGAEIALKSNFVRRFFTKKLVQSIKFALKRNKIEYSAITRGGGRLYVFCGKLKKAQKVIFTVSGIHAIAVAEQSKPAEYKEIESRTVAFAKKHLKKGNSFALDVKVVGKKSFSAKDLENKLGAAIQKAIAGLKVNLSNPEKQIFIEVRKSDFFIYASQLKCLGGLPLGVEGAVAMLFSGKQGELPAAFLLMHRGCNVFPIVGKKTAAIEKHVGKLSAFNDYRRFVLTEKKDLPALIKKRKIQAIAMADSKLDKKALASYKKFDASQSLVVLRPLLLYPEESKVKLEKFFA